MCGIAGLFRPGGLREHDQDAVRRMNAALAHRGPDDVGLWPDDHGGVVLAQRRLAIQDLSPAGAQPMRSASGRYSITYNGEIYNFHALRARLEAEGRAPNWRGHSDTEVMLAAIEAYGVSAALEMLSGMFAIALFDRETKTLTLARDPFGEKPLHIATVDGALLFASEIKALRAHPAWQGNIDRAAVTAFLRHGYIGQPLTLYREARKLAPGTATHWTHGAGLSDGVTETYWSAFEEARKARERRFSGTPDEAEAELDRLIHHAISEQVIADVPVGAFLSGGIDSSTIAAIMQAQRATPIETFSLGFREEAFNEAPYARDVAKHLGTSHNEIVLSGEDARGLLTAMPKVYDEPFADPSQLPTYMVARFARTKVTVSLSGDAGDELFAGYGRYHSLRRKWEKGGGALTRLASHTYARSLIVLAVAPAETLGLKRIAGNAVGPLRLRLEDMAAKFAASDAITAHERGFTVTDQAHRLVLGGDKAVDPLVARIGAMNTWSVLEQASLLDAERYLTDDILVKVDRAAMAHSLEARVPLLNKEIARYAWSLPDHLRMLNGERKGLLKAVLGRYVPRELWDRPKRGFGIPVAQWLRGPLRPLAAELLSREKLDRQGLLDADLVVAIWEDFLAGGQRRTNLIWTLFVLQLYLAES